MFVGYADDHAGDVYRFINIHADVAYTEMPNHEQTI